MNGSVERFEMQVPINAGPLIGNTLRQFALRGSASWQVAAYKLSKKEGTFGLGGGYNFSYLELLKGKLICPPESSLPSGNSTIVRFDLVGENYVHNGMTIVNLGKLGAPSLDVCLVYASGSRTAKQNYSVVKNISSGDVSDFVAVPSKHTSVVRFRFEVKPLTMDREILVIEASEGCVGLARDFAVTALKELDIKPLKEGV